MVNLRRMRRTVMVVVWTVCLSVCCVTANLGIYADRRQMMGTNGITGYGDHFKKSFFLNASFKSDGIINLFTVSVPSDIQAPLSLLFQRRNILKFFKRLTVDYALPGTPLDIRQK